ncbi:MAG TPA: hypothetical protein VF960_07020 [Chloroflexota bacterium]
MPLVRHFIYRSPGGQQHDVHLAEDQKIPHRGQIIIIRNEDGLRVRVTSVATGDDPNKFLATVEPV